MYSEYSVHLTPFYAYSWLLQGSTKFDKHTRVKDDNLPTNVAGISYHDMIDTYVMKNVPAFKEEEFLTSRENYLIKLNFQLTSYTDQYGVTTNITNTWDKLCKDLLNLTDFGRYMNAAGRDSKKIINYDTLKNLDPKDKFNKILSFVKSNFNCNGNRELSASKSASKFTEEKTGNCADINLYLCGMLREAGLNAYPVILSTRDHGEIKYNYPYTYFFNYVAVLVDLGGKQVLADATDPLSSNRLIPAPCLNDKGLIVDKKSDKWVKLTPTVQSQTSYAFKIDPVPDSDSLNVLMRITGTNYYALKMRKMYAGEQKNLDNYIRQQDLEELENPVEKNYHNVEKPFIILAKGTYPMEIVNNKIYIAPFLEEPASQNPFKYKTRSYPIDMSYRRTKIFTSQIDIPKGYKIERLPDSLNMPGTLVKINYEINTINKNTIMVIGSYSFNRAVYPATDYSKLKAYYDEIIDKFNEKIVLSPVK